MSGNIKGWVKETDGTTAIEFSLTAIPFVLLMVGILELAMMYTANSLIETATSNAARLIRTGQIQQSGLDPETMFREEFCDLAGTLIDCNEVVIEAIPMPDDSFMSVNGFPPQFDGSGNLSSQGFDAGAVNDVVLVRTAYQYEMMTPLVGQLLAGPGNKRLMMSTIVFQTEPYEFEGM